MMRKQLLTLPQLMFVIGTRAALGAGVALLAGRHLNDRARRRTGMALALVGAATTVPAARIVFKSKPSFVKRALARVW